MAPVAVGADLGGGLSDILSSVTGAMANTALDTLRSSVTVTPTFTYTGSEPAPSGFFNSKTLLYMGGGVGVLLLIFAMQKKRRK